MATPRGSTRLDRVSGFRYNSIKAQGVAHNSIHTSHTPSNMSFTIPRVQKVAVVPKAGGTIEIRNDWPVKQQKDLAPGECLVKIEATGTCSG